ncbi:MAG TPA: hypothetical protein VMV10_06310, partial [Pirellulales bacterium]|nr:hypothetical protein [Pirellulales bacterium]
MQLTEKTGWQQGKGAERSGPAPQPIKKPFAGGAGTYKGPSVWELPPSHVFHYGQVVKESKRFLKDFLWAERRRRFRRLQRRFVGRPSRPSVGDGLEG